MAPTEWHWANLGKLASQAEHLVITGRFTLASFFMFIVFRTRQPQVSYFVFDQSARTKNSLRAFCLNETIEEYQ